MQESIKIKNIFQYMLALKKLNEKTIYNIKDYNGKGEKIIFLNKYPKFNKGIVINKNKEDDQWIEVYKNVLDDFPAIDPILSEYLKLDLENPLNKPEITSEGKKQKHIIELYKDLELAWESFGKNNSKKQLSNELYSKLFDVYQLFKASGEEYEILFSDVLLSINIDEREILHPMITNKMELIFDGALNKFTLLPSEEFSRIEYDYLDNIYVEGFQRLLDFKKSKEKEVFQSIDCKDEETYKVLVEILSIINPMESVENIKILNTDISNGDISKEPKIYNTPIILVRKKGTKTQIEDLKEIINYIDDNKDIPDVITNLVAPTNKNTIKVNDKWTSVGKDLLFPLPANEDQRDIARRLSSNSGIVVQGPPGTGKSHTIVNLICHLLAHGKRVLVTSQTEKALSVLRDKIPGEIRDLCISLLGSDRDALKDLDNSIRIITDNLSINKNTLKKEIDEVRFKLDKCRKTQQEIIEKLKDNEERNNCPIMEKGKEYSKLDIAKWLKENENNLGYIKDKVSPYEIQPISEDEFEEIVEILKENSVTDLLRAKDIVDIKEKMPDLDELKTVLKEYKSLSEKYKDLRKNTEELTYDNNTNLDNILNNLLVYEKSLLEIQDLGYDKFFKEHNSTPIVEELTRQFVNNVSPMIKEIKMLSKDLQFAEMQIPNGNIAEIKTDFQRVYEEMSSKGKLGMIFKLKNSKVKYIIENCKINGQVLNDESQWKLSKKYIDKISKENELLLVWNNFSKEFKLKEFQDASILNIGAMGEALDKINKINKFKAITLSTLTRNIPFKLDEYDLYNLEDVKKLKNKVNDLIQLRNYEELKKYLGKIKEKLHGNKITSNIHEIINEVDIKKLENLYKEIDKLISINLISKKFNNTIYRLKKTLPSLAKDIVDNKDLSKYNSFTNAFKWIRWNNLLNDLSEENKANYENKLKNQKDLESKLILELVSKQTWFNQISRINDENKRSLYAWMEAIKKIGKGTSKYANYYKKIAQKEMDKCKNSIPVWIMPINKVIENIKVNKEAFDVIIFDESSQSDIFALQVLFRGEKAVIVGDDKQISPTQIGIEKTEVIRLINEYLKDIPNKEWFDLDTSFYNTALRVFPDKLMLKEHFRCVPEIIGFNNEFSYNDEIIPLRYPTPSERFEHPVVCVHVENGERHKTKKENIKEAKAVVNTIVKCCKDSKYDNMTMGVISLLGKEQGQLIEKLLKNELGEEEIVKRKIICGDAYSFQGDERDIIFLTMVVAKNARFASLTKDDDKKRFNVAVSRARNQAWLFYSLTLEDLNPACVRHSLLSYFLNPKEEIKEDEVKIFEDSFEEEIYNKIVEKGYIVNTKVKAGKHIIDLVVEGKNNRLAIDCENKTWKGMEKWKEDMERINQLERVGWEFVKIRGFQFYRNPNEAMKDVWEKLNKLKIEHNN